MPHRLTAVAASVLALLVAPAPARADTAPTNAPSAVLVALAGPDATPAVGKVGFWSDGRQHAVWALLSPTGRRLFIEREPDDVVRSNLGGFQAALSDD